MDRVTQTLKLRPNSGLLARKNDPKLVESYLNVSPAELAVIVRSNGRGRTVDAVVRHIKDTYVENFEDLVRINTYKKERSRIVSTPEITTALVLVNNGISFSWENFKLFKQDENKNWDVIFPDFVTNLMTDNKLTVIEYHALELERITVKDPDKRKSNVKRKLVKWSNCISGRNYFMVFCGDLQREELVNSCNGEVPNFAEIYVPLPSKKLKDNSEITPDVFLNDGSIVDLKIEKEKFKDNRRIVIKQLRTLKHESGRVTQKIHMYYSVLDSFLKKLIRDNRTEKLLKEDFLITLDQDVNNGLKDILDAF